MYLFPYLIVPILVVLARRNNRYDYYYTAILLLAYPILIAYVYTIYPKSVTDQDVALTKSLILLNTFWLLPMALLLQRALKWVWN